MILYQRFHIIVISILTLRILKNIVILFLKNIQLYTVVKKNKKRNFYVSHFTGFILFSLSFFNPKFYISQGFGWGQLETCPGSCGLPQN